jgi:hypothetical protein
MRVSLGWVRDRWVARLLDADEAMSLGTPADGIASLSKAKGKPKARVRPLRDLESLHRNLLVAGCDPALGLLGRRSPVAGIAGAHAGVLHVPNTTAPAPDPTARGSDW